MKTTIENGVTIINTGDAVGGIKTVSGHTGVVWLKDAQLYRAEIYLKQKKYNLGRFKDIEDAIALRKEAEAHRAAGTLDEWFKTLKEKRLTI
jgi:hypothetical protein